MLDYTGRERRGISMPICFMPKRPPDKDGVRDKALGVSRTVSIKSVPDGTPPEWREPPGYLGEAVRRAKRIASPGRPVEASKPAPKDC